VLIRLTLQALAVFAVVLDGQSLPWPMYVGATALVAGAVLPRRWTDGVVAAAAIGAITLASALTPLAVVLLALAALPATERNWRCLATHVAAIPLALAVMAAPLGRFLSIPVLSAATPAGVAVTGLASATVLASVPLVASGLKWIHHLRRAPPTEPSLASGPGKSGNGHGPARD
jgi:hypothetical protein